MYIPWLNFWIAENGQSRQKYVEYKWRVFCKVWGSYINVGQDSGLLRYDTVWLDDCSLTFWQKVIALYAGVRHSKKNNIWLFDPWRRKLCIPLKHDDPLTQQYTVPESSINILYLMALVY
jgi:hypothetical protein